MSYCYAYRACAAVPVPVQFLDNYGIPIQGILNYARVDDFRVIFPRFGPDDLKPKLEGCSIWGPLTNNNTIGDAVIKRGGFLNTASINRLLIEQGPIDNRGYIGSAYLDQGYLANYGTIGELFVDEGTFDNYGHVQVLYKVRKNQFFYYTDLGNNAEYIVHQFYSPIQSTSYVNEYQPDSSDDNYDAFEGGLISSRSARYSDLNRAVLDDTWSGSFPDDTDNDLDDPPAAREDENGNNPTEIESEMEDEQEENACANVKRTISLESSESLLGIKCRICFEPVKHREPVSTACGHIYCKKCLTKSVRSDAQRKCPTCKMILPKHNMYHRIFI